MTEEMYSIRVERGELAVEVAGTRDFVEDQFDELSETYLNGEGQTESNNPPSSSTTSTSNKQASLGELYSDADIQYKRDAALLVGWYLEYIEDQADFIKSEIEERALKAKVELGANLSRDLSTLIEKGYLQEVGSRDGEKSYYLTRSGESYLTNEFSLKEHIA